MALLFEGEEAPLVGCVGGPWTWCAEGTRPEKASRRNACFTELLMAYLNGFHG